MYWYSDSGACHYFFKNLSTCVDSVLAFTIMSIDDRMSPTIVTVTVLYLYTEGNSEDKKFYQSKFNLLMKRSWPNG